MNQANQTNQLLSDKLTDLAAHTIYQSYGTTTVEDAFCMALGELEVEFDIDMEIQLTDELMKEINNIINILNI